MRIFGQIAELTKVLWRKNGKTVELTPSEPTVSTVITIPDPGGATEEVVLKDADQTLTNKHISADQVDSGQLADAQISESSVTQHVGAIDHDSLLNFVADEHVDHSSVSITAGNGLQGGGNITSSITLSLNLAELIDATPELVDSVALVDNSDNSSKKVPISQVNSILLHDNLSGVDANEHVDHSSVLLTGGTGITVDGGVSGDITASRIIAVDESALTLDNIGGILATTKGGTGVNSSATFPTSGVVVTEDDTQTLTNKSLTAPTLTGLSSVEAVTFSSVDVSAAGSSLTVTDDYSVYILKPGFGTTLSNISGGVNGRTVTIINGTVGYVEVSDYAPGSGTIATGLEQPLQLAIGGSFTATYNSGTWHVNSNNINLVTVSGAQELTSKTLLGGALEGTTLKYFFLAETDVSDAGPTLTITTDDSVYRLQSGFGPTLTTITPAAVGRQVTVVNETNASLTITDGTIITSTGADLVIEDDAAVTLLSDGTNWNVVGGAGAGGGLATEFVAADPAPASNNTHYLVDCSGGPVTITLPDSPQPGAVIRVSDESGTSGTDNITISGNGNTIEGDSSFIIDVDDGWAQLHWDGVSDWHVDTLAVSATAGILSLGGQSGAAYPTQTFSSTDASITINSAAGDHDIELADTIPGARTFSGAVTLRADSSLTRSSNFVDAIFTISQGSSTVGNKSILRFADSTGGTAEITGYGSAYGGIRNNAIGFTTAGTEKILITETGAVTLGPSTDRGLDSYHTTFKNIMHGTPGTASSTNGSWQIGSNTWSVGGREPTRLTGLTGGIIRFITQTTNTANTIQFFMNQAADPVSGTTTDDVGGISAAGAWTLGPSGGTSTHTVNGPLTVDPGGTTGNFTVASTGLSNQVLLNNGVLTRFGGTIVPDLDNIHDVGSLTNRWDDIYATNNVIQTSDARDKEDVVDLDLGLDFVSKLRPVNFRWIGGTRKHQGFIAQELEQAILDLGKTTQDVASLIKGNLEQPEGDRTDRYGIRYGELIAPMVKAIQELAALRSGDLEQIAELQSRIETLEGGN